MSYGYGFLTQSTIIPKKSKQIKINDNSGQVLLESILQQQKQRLKNKSKNDKPVTSKQPKRNAGIEQRMKKDQQQHIKINLVQKNYYKCLQKKAEVYDKVNQKKINIDKLLVNFEDKQQQRKKEQQDQYQKIRQAFYKGEIKQIENQQKNLHEVIQTQNTGTAMLRQRLAWEKQMLNQMNGTEIQQKKPKVIQSFDNKLTKYERQAFQKVLTQQERQKTKLDAIRRRKQIMEQQKLKKLRKLNIIKDVSQAALLQRNDKAFKKQQQQNQQEQRQK